MFRNLRLRQATNPFGVRRFGSFSCRLLSPVGVQSDSSASADASKKDPNRTTPVDADKKETSGNANKKDPNADKKTDSNRSPNESKWQRWGKRFLRVTAVGAMSGTVAFGCFAGIKELKKREAILLEKIQKLESYGLRSCS